jgi:hypothetical protein
MLLHSMPPKISKRKGCDAESSNILNRIRKAMRMIGVPETAARLRYAKLFMCCHTMRGVCKRWQAARAMHEIIKDWILCPWDVPASEPLLQATRVWENELEIAARLP